MKQGTLLMLVGFIPAAIFLSLMWFVDMSAATKVVVSIGESLGIGVGSIGLGIRIARGKNK